MSLKEKYAQPMEVSDVMAAFPADLGDLLPPYSELDDDFRNGSNPWCKYVSGLFFSGGDLRKLKENRGVDRKAAIRHLTAVLRSFEPKHEHKIAGAGYLASIWFEEVPS